ncbi:apolipoprotein C-IV [Polymixia lowei]
MQKMVPVVVLVLLMQACRPLVGQTSAREAEESDSPGIFERVATGAREVKAKVQRVGGTVLGFAGAYYEDHVKTTVDPYVKWASNVTSTLWESFQNNRPF